MKQMKDLDRVDYRHLEQSLQRLKDQYANLLTLDERNISGIDREAIQESVIQRFEVCFDTLWKHLGKFLGEEGVVMKLITPKSIFRTAYRNGMMNSEDLKNFFDYTRARNDTSHNYDMEKANETLSKVNDFIHDATELSKALPK